MSKNLVTQSDDMSETPIEQEGVANQEESQENRQMGNGRAPLDPELELDDLAEVNKN